MPTILTPEVRQSIHECLGSYQSGAFTWYTYSDKVTGMVTSVPITNNIDFSVAVNVLDGLLNDIETDTDGRKQRLAVLAQEWTDVSTSVLRIEKGGVAGASGAREDPEEARQRIRAVVSQVVCFRFIAAGPYDNDSAGPGVFDILGGAYGGLGGAVTR
jgi:hypothetical protein